MTIKKSHSDNIAIFGLIIGCLIFGAGGVIVAVLPIGSYAVAFWRLLVAGVIFLILAKIFRQNFPKNRQALQFALISGALLGLDLALWHESIHSIGVGISTLLNSLQIFFLALIGYLWFNEKQSKLQIYSLILAISGVALIGSPEFSQNNKAVWGFISGILSGAMLAGSMTYIRKSHQAEQVQCQQDVAIFPMMFLVSVGGVLALLLPMLWLDFGKILPTTWQQVGLILAYGAIGQCLAWGLIAYSIPRLSLALTGLLLLSEPVIALLIDYFYLQKEIVGLQWFGAFLTMFAIYLGSVKR